MAGIDKKTYAAAVKSVKSYLADTLSAGGTNLLNPDNYIAGKNIYGWDDGQTISNPWRDISGNTALGVYELPTDVGYIFSYNLFNSTKAKIDIYNSDGSYSRTVISSLVTITGDEKYVAIALHTKAYPILGTEQLIPATEDYTTYHYCVDYSQIDVLQAELENTNAKLQKSITDAQEGLYRGSLLNPFQYSENTEGYVTFVFDDGNEDLDLVASIFESYEIPLCVAIPLETLKTTCTGLTEATGSFTVGMTIKEVCDTIVANGGEVLAHNYTPITADNYTDFDLMYKTFATSKQTLTENGFDIRGILLAGGTNAVYGSDNTTIGTAFEKWSLMYYDYSDGYGISPQYVPKRINMNVAVDTVESKISAAMTNKTHLAFFCHTLKGTETYVTEENLKTILQYCKDNSVNVVTYATYHDAHKSSELAEKIKNL